MEDTNNNTSPFQIFVKLLNGQTATLRFTNPYPNAQSIKTRIHQITKIPTNILLLVSNGRQLRQNSVITTPDSTVHLLLPLLGGKGGFGSLLRGSANKAGQKKTNNFDACRDMSGRRLRHVNAEKRLEEWKAEQEERKLEKIAEDFIKKNAKKGKKGVGDGAAEKYVAKYREESARCAKQVEDAVKEACSGLGNGKRKGKVGEVEGLDSKRLKIWMGKRKLAESDSEDSSDEEVDEKSVVLNSGNPMVIKEADVSSDSVTGGKRDGDISGGASCESGSEEDKDAVAIEQNLKSSPLEEIVPSKGNEVVEPEIHEVVVPQSAGIAGSEATDTSKIDAVDSVKDENDALDSPAVQVLAPATTEVAESKPISADSDVVTNVEETHMEKPFNFDGFNLAADMEALGMERLKNELQAHGLKCGGTLQERAARLFLLKTTPLDKLPKKLLAKK